MDVSMVVNGKSVSGSVEGRVTFAEKKVPKAKVRDDTGALRDLIHVDRKTKGVQAVLVYLTAQGDQAAPAEGSVLEDPATYVARLNKLLVEMSSA